MVIALVVLWVVVGLGVFLVAMRPRGGAATAGPPSRGARRFTTGAIAVTYAVFGVALPAVVIAATRDSTRNDPAGQKLSSSEAHGRKLFAQNCSTCHALAAANAVARVGPSLDDLRPPKALVVNAIQVGRASGSNQLMPAGLLRGKDAQDVASFIAKVTKTAGG